MKIKWYKKYSRTHNKINKKINTKKLLDPESSSARRALGNW
jgi:hypothetical protein